ncbi:hypothetical protein Cgig2_032324 [Carnegiea gigantea]|uniref:Glutaredoxin n=1 Tax=Carnegiea gigantea TaxID=171969 RepID=A0A9Q1QJE3_9CARY|nr:hypothetical protein Cgig2_032324 [Carnegiea gigantea]
MDRVNELAKTKAAVIFTKSSCCMCHSIKSLFYDLGASPVVYELDGEASGREMEWALQRLGCNPTVPAVFIGGKYVGSARDVRSLVLKTWNWNRIHYTVHYKKKIFILHFTCTMGGNLKKLTTLYKIWETGYKQIEHDCDKLSLLELESISNEDCKYEGAVMEFWWQSSQKRDELRRIKGDKEVVDVVSRLGI